MERAVSINDRAIPGKAQINNFDLTVSTDIPHDTWDTFLENTPGGHHTQTSEWARIKGTLGWNAKRVILSKGNQILAGAQILIKNTRLGVTVGYVPKGPLVVGETLDLARILLRQIMEISDQERCQLMAIQPPNNGFYLTELLEEMNFCQSNLELAPTASLVMDLSVGEEQLLKQMKQKTRQHIHQSMRAGFQICEANSENDMDNFYSLYCCTAKRQGFVPFKRSYFDALWNAFKPRDWVSLLLVCYEGEPITGQLLIPFGDTVVGKMIGWSGKYPHLRPNEASYWSSIQWCIQKGYRYFDFEGVNADDVKQGIGGKDCTKRRDIFKYGFNAEPVLFPPAYDFVPNRVASWFYRQFQPDMEGKNLTSRMLEILRKR